MEQHQVEQHTTAMKSVKITLKETARSDISDSTGHTYKDGDKAELSDTDADLFVSLKCAVFVDGSSAIQAAADAKERTAASEQATQRHRSQQAMAIHDALPPEVRAEAHEHGDEVVENYLARNRVQVPSKPITNESVDTSFKDMIDDLEPETPKRKRGRPRKDGT